MISKAEKAVIIFLCVLLLWPFSLTEVLAQSRQAVRERPAVPADSIAADTLAPGRSAYLDAGIAVERPAEEADTVMTVVEERLPYGLGDKKIFNPDPTRAVWLSALFPGLGQVYNRRYWKLPIVVGGFMGLAYGTSWNNGQYRDYTQAYRDLLDADPSTKSYMDFFPPTVDESSLDKTWLTATMKSRKDYYRRNRDLCIICIVGLYLLCMLDAYVDASMSHFDISPNLSMDVAPSMLVIPGQRRPNLGLNWALTF